MDEDDLKTFEDTIFLAETGLSIPNSDFDDDDDEYLYTYSLLGVASPLSLYLWTNALPDGGWREQPKHLVLSNKEQIYKTYIVVIVG